jgi:hypothetical protein
LLRIFAKKTFGLVHQVLVCVKFIVEYFCGTTILAETAIIAVAVYGWARIQRDGILRTDFQTFLARAFPEPHSAAKNRRGGDSVILIEENL